MMSTEEFKEIYLWDSRPNIASSDKDSLSKWEKHKISTETCIRQLANRNKWENKPSESDFIIYAATLGWYR